MTKSNLEQKGFILAYMLHSFTEGTKTETQTMSLEK